VQVHFQLTYEEFREGVTGGVSPLAAIVLSWGLTFVFLGFLILLSILSAPAANELLPGSPATILGRATQLLADSALAIALMALPLIAITVALFRKPALPWRPVKPTVLTRLKPIASGVLIGILLMWLNAMDQSAAQAVSLVPVTVYCLSIMIFSIASSQRTPWNQWRVSTNMQLPTTLEASAEGLTFHHAEGTLQYPWAAIKGYRETANLLLLFLTPALMWMIPKRSFGSLAEEAVFRQQLSQNVPEGIFLTGGAGFSVEMRAPSPTRPPPLPVHHPAAAEQALTDVSAAASFAPDESAGGLPPGHKPTGPQGQSMAGR